MVRNRSYPAVSQTCNFTRYPSTFIVFILKSIPTNPQLAYSQCITKYWPIQNEEKIINKKLLTNCGHVAGGEIIFGEAQEHAGLSD
jgi:hypothetical protein